MCVDNPCPLCGKEVIPECGGTGYIHTDRERNIVRDCPRMYLKQLKKHLGPEMDRVKHFKNSPLFKIRPGKEPVDLTKVSIRTPCEWFSFLGHYKWAMICKGLGFKSRIVTDNEILNVYLGNESYRNNAPSRRDQSGLYNNIMDLLEDHWDLIVLRLGVLSYKNVAAPGAILEALRHRRDRDKPIWVVENFSDVPYSKNTLVEKYLSENFTAVSLQESDSKKTVTTLYEDCDSEDGRPDFVNPLVASRNETATDFGILPELGPRESTPSKTWGKKNRNGGGPV